MAQTAMTVRLDKEQKMRFDELCSDFGMSANTAINIFVNAVIRTGSIPSKITKSPDDKIREKALKAIEGIRADAMSRPEMTLEEINAEIDAVRTAKFAR
ncbi:MAG: type II toxin-antitoxin system RelB/DinJ family antitoxin [Muribaculaceae bacterium]